MKSFIDILQRAEHLAGFIPQNAGKRPYKIVDNVWIKGDLPLIKTYHKTLKNSELPVFPNPNFKTWGVFVLQKLKDRNTNHNFRKLLGYGLSWSFLKKEYVPLNADIIYYRQRAVVMVYTEAKRVLKIAVTKQGKKDMDNEVISQRMASNIPSEYIFIPSIIQELRNEDINFTVEEYFEGKRQSFKNKSVLEANYHKVFQFLLKFYLSAPIELQALSESKFLNHDFVEEFIRQQADGAEVLSIFRKLYAKQKRMILCRIHGDLNHNNILSNGETVCIIDWGRSKHNYLFRDLDNSSFDTKPIFEQFLVLNKIESEKVYPYHEQLFLEIFLEMCRWVHNGIKRKTLGPGIYNWVDIKNQKLIEISKNFGWK